MAIAHGLDLAHPWRTVRQDRDTGLLKRGQYIHKDVRMSTSPAVAELTGRQTQFLELLIGKWGKQTEDGSRHGFDFGVPFAFRDVRDIRMSKSTFMVAQVRIPDLGLARCVEVGNRTMRGKRAAANKLAPCDAWKATLKPTKVSKVDTALLPKFHDPRRLPILMEIVDELGENCVWGRYKEIAESINFPSDASKAVSNKGKTSPEKQSNNCTASGPEIDTLSISDEAMTEGDIGGDHKVNTPPPRRSSLTHPLDVNVTFASEAWASMSSDDIGRFVDMSSCLQIDAGLSKEQADKIAFERITGISAKNV